MRISDWSSDVCSSDLIGTLALLFVIVAIGSKLVAMPAFLGPEVVGLLVWGIGLSLGGSTGYALNPARDLGPCIMHAILPISEIGRTSCRGSVCQYVWISVVPVSLKKKETSQ